MTGRFHIRPAQASDEAGVRALSAHIWDGQDYIPGAFADWLNEPFGQFTIIYEGNELVALGKLTRLAEGEWWLEGLRVAPAHRGRGLGRLLHNYHLNLADEMGSGWLRLATASSTKAIHKLAAESNFQRVSRHLIAQRTVETPDMAHEFRSVPAEQSRSVLSWLDASATHRAYGGLLEDEWVWYTIEPRLPELLTQGRVYWWRPAGDSATGLVIVHPLDEDVLWLNYMDVAAADRPGLLSALPGLAAEIGKQRIEAKPLSSEAMKRDLVAAGWQIISEEEMVLFARPLTRTDHDTIGGEK